MVLKRIGPLSVAKIMGAVYGTLGLIFGCIFALLSLVGAGLASAAESEGGGILGLLFGVGAVIILPLFYGAIGFVVGAIGAALYNLFAGFVGGISLDLE